MKQLNYQFAIGEDSSIPKLLDSSSSNIIDAINNDKPQVNAEIERRKSLVNYVIKNSKVFFGEESLLGRIHVGRSKGEVLALIDRDHVEASSSRV